jgi:hypothetical protein
VDDRRRGRDRKHGVDHRGVYGPLIAKQSLGGPAPWGAIAACEGVGLLLGGFLLLRYRPARPLLTGTAALAVGALPLLLLAEWRWTPAIAAAFLLAGLALEVFNTTWVTVL